MPGKVSELLRGIVMWTNRPGKIQYTGDNKVVMVSYYLFSVFGYTFKLHAFVREDVSECFHSHAGDSYRMVLSGGYTEEILDYVFPGLLLDALDQTRRDINRNDSKSLHNAKAKCQRLYANLSSIYEFYATRLRVDLNLSTNFKDMFIREYRQIPRFKMSKVDANLVHRIKSVKNDTWSLWITRNKDQQPIVTIGDGWL